MNDAITVPNAVLKFGAYEAMTEPALMIFIPISSGYELGSETTTEYVPPEQSIIGSVYELPVVKLEPKV
ncbi:MAG: Uncharacterised protein [Cryomorphaceae bacterium]|nr:MAG: Uncharacterised protein [Cryomorphaceae bacterium]